MKTEIVYLGHDNSINVILKADGVAVALDDVTSMTLTFGTTLVSSDNGDDDPIRWAKEGYEDGEVRIFLGDQTITAAAYRAPLVVYDPTNTDGLVWGLIPMTVAVDPEASSP